MIRICFSLVSVSVGCLFIFENILFQQQQQLVITETTSCKYK